MLKNIFIMLLSNICLGNTTLSAHAQEAQEPFVYREFYDSGRVKLEMAYDGERLDGATRFFYDNGQMACELFFEKGILTAVGDFFDQDGALANGKVSEKHSNGTTWFEGNVVNGKIEGEVKAYYPDGKLEQTAFFVKGQAIALNEADQPADGPTANSFNSRPEGASLP